MYLGGGDAGFSHGNVHIMFISSEIEIKSKTMDSTFKKKNQKKNHLSPPFLSLSSLSCGFSFSVGSEKTW